MNPNLIKLTTTIHYEASRSLDVNDGDPGDFILPVDGTIHGQPEDDELAALKIQLGELKLYRIQVGSAYDEGVSLSTVLDTYQQTMDAGCVILNDSFDDFSPWVRQRYDDAVPWNDLLLLDRLTLDPAVRGQRLGLAVLYRAIRDWSGG